MSDLSAVPPPSPQPQQATSEQVDNVVKVRASEAGTAAMLMTTRPGWRTTEFWVTLFVAAAGVLTNVYSNKPWAQVAGAVAAALVSMGYVQGRSKIKAAP